MRNIYTSELNIERYGERDDGSSFERFRVLFPEDVVKVVWNHHNCSEYHFLKMGERGTCLDAVIEELDLVEEVTKLRSKLTNSGENDEP